MKYFWDESIRKYRDEDGKIVPESELRRWIDDLTKALMLLFMNRSKPLLEGFTMELFVLWSSSMRSDLSSLHYLMTLVAFGGSSQMNNQKWFESEKIIAEQLSYFDSFQREILSGQQLLNGTLPVRAGLYALAGFATFIAAETLREMFAGKTQEKNILGRSDHCRTCLNETAREWVPIGTLIPIGSRECLVRCRCHKIYR